MPRRTEDTAKRPGSGRDGPAPTGLARVRSILLTVLGVEVTILVVTGIALFFVYRPTAFEAWGDIATRTDDWGVRLAVGIRLLHLLASRLAVPTAIAAGLLVAVGGRAGLRRGAATDAALGVGLAATTLAASFTGFLLPWDNLALWAVKVGTSLTGYRAIFGPDVRFVLIGGVEITTANLIRWLLIHMLVLGPALGGLIVLAWRRHRPAGRRRASPEAG